MKRKLLLLLLMVSCLGGTVFAQTATKNKPVHHFHHKHHKKHMVVKRITQKVEIKDDSNKTVVEIKNGTIYVDGTVVATNNKAKNTDYKIVIRHDEHSGHMRHEHGDTRNTDADHDNDDATVSTNDVSERKEQPERAEQRERTEDREPMERNEHGPAYLGITGSNATLLNGAYVAGVMTNSPAWYSGLHESDVITHVNQTEISSFEGLKEIIEGYQPGDVVLLTYTRNDNTEQTRATLSEKPGMNQQTTPNLYKRGGGGLYLSDSRDHMMDSIYRHYHHYHTGMGRELELHHFGDGNNNEQQGDQSNNYQRYNEGTNEDGRSYRGEHGRGRRPVRFGINASDGRKPHGVYLEEVKVNSPAEAAGLQKGDVITRINGERVRNAFDMQELLRMPYGGSDFTVDYRHNGQRMRTEVHIGR